MELVCDLHADLALAAALEMRHPEFMLIVAGIQCDWLALETVAYSLFLTVIAAQSNDPMLLAFHAVIIPIFRSRYIRQDMIFTAFQDDGPLLVDRNTLAVCHACLTESCVTDLIVIIDLLGFSTPHAAIVLFLLSEALEVHHIIPLQLMLKSTCAVSIDVYQLATDAVCFGAIGTPLWAFLIFFAQLAFHCMVEGIDDVQFSPTRAIRVDIGDEFSRLRLVKFIGEFTETPLTNAEVTQAIIINPVIADCCTHSADITDKVEIGDALKGKLVSQGAARFGTRRHPAGHAVILVTDPAKRSAKFGLSTCHAGSLNHLLIGSNEELELMAMETPVLLLHLLEVPFLRGGVLADAVVLVEAAETFDGDGTGGGVVGAEEIELDIRDSLYQEGGAALVGAAVDVLPDIGDTLHAEYLGTLAFASYGFDADLVAYATLVFVSYLIRTQKTSSCQSFFLHRFILFKFYMILPCFYF